MDRAIAFIAFIGLASVFLAFSIILVGWILHDALVELRSVVRWIAKYVWSRSDEEEKISEHEYNQEVRKREHLEDRVKRLTKRKKLEKLKMFRLGVSISRFIEETPWTLAKDDESIYLVYKERVEPTHIQFKGRILQIPEKYRGKFYVKNLRVKMNEKVSKAFAKEGFHPNLSKEDKWCLGELKGEDLETILQKVPEQMKTINLHGRDSYQTGFPGYDEAIEIVNELAKTYRARKDDEAFTAVGSRDFPKVLDENDVNLGNK